MSAETGDFHDQLTKTLRRGQHVGIIGGDIADHHSHAMAWIQAIGPLDAAFCVDLGTGAGLPGLALALANPQSRWLLTEARGTRATFVRSAVRQLQLQDRVSVWDTDVQAAAHVSEYREQADVVTARAFGSPAITAECATGFLRLGGQLVVSEPPTDGPIDEPNRAATETSDVQGGALERRWPATALATLGLGPGELRIETYRFAIIKRVSEIDPALPRRRPAMERKPHF